MSRPPTQRLRPTWAALTAAAGLATLAAALAIALAALPAIRAADGCVAADSLVRFELARTLAELQQVLHGPGDLCRGPALAAMERANRLDLLGFIPGYTVLGVSAALWLGSGRRRPLVLAAVLAAGAACVADCAETLRLLAIARDVEAHADLARVSGLAARIKFDALAVHAALLAALGFLAAPRRWRLGLVLLAPGLARALPLAAPERSSAVTLACVFGWAVLTALALADMAAGAAIGRRASPASA